MLTKKEQSLLDALEPMAKESGVELVTLEIVGAKKSPTIRVYIDTDHGVGFDELSSAQAWINEIMEDGMTILELRRRLDDFIRDEEAEKVLDEYIKRGFGNWICKGHILDYPSCRRLRRRSFYIP